MVKLKFGGMSFGGKKPIVVIFGKNYKLRFGKHRKKECYGFEVKKKRKVDFFLKYFYFLFPLLDIPNYLAANPPKFIADVASPVVSKAEEINEAIGGFSLPSWGVIILLFLYAFTMYYGMYYIIFRGVRTWHGTEHKLISAAENNDLDNVKKYDPIHERCGGTIMPTIIFASLVFVAFYCLTGISYGQMTFVTIAIFLNVKYLHKYDKFGIWFGKKFQKYVSISEPADWQLTVGTAGMKELVKAEQGKEYTPSNNVMDYIKQKRKLSLKGSIPAIIIIALSLSIIIGAVTMPPLPDINYTTEKYVTFSGLPNETKADYVLVQVNATGKTLQVDRIRIWGLFNQINSSVEFNETIYKGLSLYVSKNNGTSMFINDTKTDPIINYWEITAKNCSLMPIDEQTLLNFTFVFDLPPGCYNESVLFNYTPVMRFTSFV